LLFLSQASHGREGIDGFPDHPVQVAEGPIHRTAETRAGHNADMSITPSKRSPWVYAVAGTVTTVLLALAGRYGPHRDELYFIAAGNHPQLGYPDQPPLTPLVAAAADHLAPGSLFALRLLSAVLIGGVVLLTADLARELGGDASAELLAAITVGVAGGVLAVGHLLSTSTLDLFAWTVVIRLVVAVLHRDTPRGWLWVGLAAGLGLENKSLVAPLLAGLVLGIALTPELRKHLRSPWAWAGAALALLLWAPNLWWQAQNGWPQATLSADIRAEYGTLGGTAGLIIFQFLLLNWLGAVLAWNGLLALLRREAWRYARPVAIAYLALLVFFIVTGGKPYYLTGLLAALAAAGAVAVSERWSASQPKRFTVLVALTALIPLPALLPVLPAQTFADSFFPALNEDGLETIGWPRVVAQVRAVADTLPPDQRRSAVVVASNYGEAGALLWYGGTPPVYSGHNGFADWGPPPESSGPMLYVGEQVPGADVLTGCRRTATLDTGADNEENGNGIWTCAGPTGSWAQAWPHLRHLSA
jgi:4-amino-4-deoxy-L-arabinose transferase-like glycosyltransferase